MWQALKPNCIRASTDRWYSVTREQKWSYPKKGAVTAARLGLPGFTQILPGKPGELKLIVKIDFSGLGKYEAEYVFFTSSHVETMETILRAKTPSWPTFPLWFISKVLSLIGWPHHKESILWKNGHSNEEMLRLMADHRALDLMGLLSLLCRDGMFCGTVISQTSGHHADLQAVRLANDFLERI